MTFPKGSMLDYLFKLNAEYPNDIAFEYYGRKTTLKEPCCAKLLDALDLLL